MYRFLFIFCSVVFAACIAAYFGACRTLVPGDSGGYHEKAALVACVIAGVFCIVFRTLVAKRRGAS